MAKHSSATVREQSPHVLETSRTNTIVNALKRRALAVLNDDSLDTQSRAIIRYGLETNDPWLAELVRRAEAGEDVVDTFDSHVDTLDVLQASATKMHTPSLHASNEHASNNHAASAHGHSEQCSSEQRIEALTEIICRAGDELAAALFVLMGTLEDSAHPTALANTAKHVCLSSLQRPEAVENR